MNKVEYDNKVKTAAIEVINRINGGDKLHSKQVREIAAKYGVPYLAVDAFLIKNYGKKI